MTVTIEDKRQWAVDEADRLRECIELGEMPDDEGTRTELSVIEAIARDYRQFGDRMALADLGCPRELPAFLRPQGELPSLSQPIAGMISSLAAPPIRAGVGPVGLIAIGAVALALSLISAWQIDRVIADVYYAGQLQE